jgi:hypothetical protein
MGYLTNNQIKSVFDLKRSRMQQPDPEAVYSEVEEHIGRRAKKRVILKTIAVVVEAAVLGLLIYFYLLNR